MAMRLSSMFTVLNDCERTEKPAKKFEGTITQWEKDGEKIAVGNFSTNNNLVFSPGGEIVFEGAEARGLRNCGTLHV
jgi:hypothetical protein